MDETNRVIRMDFGEPKGLGISKNALSCAAKYLLESKNEYAPLYGETFLLDKLVDYFDYEYGISTDNQNFLVTNGGLFGIRLVIEYLCQKGIKKIYIPDPGFPPYQHINKNTRATISTYKATSSSIMFKEINTINKKEKDVVIIVTSPNNPNGIMLNPEDLKKLDVNKNENKFILDNSFHNYCYKYNPDILLSENVFNIFSFSKSHALASYRIGFIHNENEKIISDLAKLQWNKTLSVSGISQVMAYGALDTVGNLKENKRIIKEQLDYATDFLNLNGISVHYPNGGFFLWINVKSIDINELINVAFNKFNLSIMEGSHFGTEGKDYIRINCALDSESLNEGLVRLVNLFNYFKDR